MRFQVQALGIIHTGHATKEETPIQGAFRPEAEGTVEVFPEYAAGLQDIGLFSRGEQGIHACGNGPDFDDAEKGRDPFRHIRREDADALADPHVEAL